MGPSRHREQMDLEPLGDVGVRDDLGVVSEAIRRSRHPARILKVVIVIHARREIVEL